METDILEHILDGREKPTNLPLALLKNITHHFSEDRVIGQGGFATVYKGVHPRGYVAVKRIRSNHSIDDKLFYREVDSLLTISHQNIVQFLGFCASTDQTAIKVEGVRNHIYAEIREIILCFEYICNGSLQKYITDELRGLEWNTRYQIIRGICEGLHHLHKESHIYHLDLKPANILLDNHMVPKITDFGLSRLDEKSQTMSEDRYGSLGYCAPEYLHSGKMSFKSDIFSLGIIITELVTGEKVIPNNNNNVLRRWRHRWNKSGNKMPMLVYQQVAKCLEIGLLCQEIDPSKRPFIWDLIHDIREMEGVNGTISNADGYTSGQISPYSENDMLGVEPLELHFPFELNKQISSSLKLTNQTEAYIAFNIQNMSPLPYCIQPTKGIVPPWSKCCVDVTLNLQNKAPRDMQRANELIVCSTKVNDGLADGHIANMFSTESDMVDTMNLDVVFYAEESSKVSKELTLHNITEDMSNIKTSGTVEGLKQSQECLLPTSLWTSSTRSQNHQEAAKESSETRQASDKTSEMEAHKELRLDMQCTDKLLVLSTTASKDLAVETVPGKMFIKNKDGKVVNEVISNERLSPMSNFSESSTSNQHYQEGAQAFSEPQLACDTTTETQIISMEDIGGYGIVAMDLNQTEPLIITSHYSLPVQIWNSDTQKLVVSINMPKQEATVMSVKFIARMGWFLAATEDGLIHVYNYKKETQNITSIRAHGSYFKAPSCYACSLAIHPTQSYVLSACTTRIKLWDWDHNWKCMRTFKGHSDDIRALAFNPEDYSSFASASDDGEIKVWCLDSPKSKYTMDGHSSWVCSLDFFTRDGQQYLISGSRDCTAKIWDMQQKECVHTLPHRYTVGSVLAHPKLPVLLTGTDDGHVYVWSSVNFRLKRMLNICGLLYVQRLACLNESGRVVVAQNKGLSMIEIGDDEEHNESSSNNENSISATH